MARKKQTPRKTKKRVQFSTISPTVRGQFAPGFAPPATPQSKKLPSQKTWENMMSNLEAKYNTEQAMLDKYQEPTDAQWDIIEAADSRYKRPKKANKKPRKKKVSGVALLTDALNATRKRKRATKRSSGKKKTTRKRKPPVSRKKGKTCMTLAQIAKAFPDMAHQVCFHPNVASFRSLMSTPASSKRKASTFL